MTHFPYTGTVQILEILGGRQAGWLAYFSNKNLEVFGEKIRTKYLLSINISHAKCRI